MESSIITYNPSLNMRYGYIVLLALVLGLPFGLRSLALRGGKADRTVQGGESLVIVTPHNGDIRREFARAFDQWHRQHYGQGVSIDYRVPGGTTDMVRLLTGTFDGWRRPDGTLPPDVNVGLDVVCGGGDYTFYHSLQPAGILEPIHIDPALLHAAIPDDSLAGVRLYDATKNAQGQPTPTWIGVALSSFGIIYNPQLYQTLDLAPPAAWADLTDPKLFGFVSLADPAHSGSASVAYMMVLQRAMADGEQTLLAQHPDLAKLPRSDLKKRPEYIRAISDGWHRGMGQLLLIAANSRYFTDSAEIVPTDVARGEAAAGMAIDFYARVTVGTVGPERAAFVSPHAATAITPDPVAILHGVSGKRLKIAMHFVEFLLTPEGQRLWILQPGQPDGPAERSLRRMPIRKDIYSNQTGWADHFDPFTEAGGFNQRGEWMALMGDTLPVWEAAWIDSRDALIDAYGRILHVSDPTLRSKLLRELADVPVTMQDIEQRRAERLQMEKTHADVFDWLARDRIAWGNRFRAHYRSVVSQIRSGA